MLQKLTAPLGSLSSLRRGLLWRWCRPLMSKVSVSVLSHQSGNLLTTPRKFSVGKNIHTKYKRKLTCLGSEVKPINLSTRSIYAKRKFQKIWFLDEFHKFHCQRTWVNFEKFGRSENPSSSRSQTQTHTHTHTHTRNISLPSPEG